MGKEKYVRKKVFFYDAFQLITQNLIQDDSFLNNKVRLSIINYYQLSTKNFN